MKIACVIPTYNNLRGLKSTLGSILGQSRKPDAVYVIDNASSDKTASVRELFPEVKYIRLPENRGSAGGYYEGIREVQDGSDLIFISDDDQVYRRDALEQLEKGLAALNAAGDVGAVRCAWENYEGAGPEEITDSVWSGTLLRSDVARKIGLPIRELFLYAEDVEYFWRMHKAGFRFYLLPAAKYLARDSSHKAEISSPFKPALIYKDDFRLYYAFRNEIYVYRLYGSWRLARVLLYFLKIAVFLKFSGVIAALDGIKDGFLGRLGKNEKYGVLRGTPGLDISPEDCALPGVSIVIPTYNGKKLLAENLPFVLADRAGYGGETEVLVVDDASADGTAAFLAAEFPGVKVIRSEKNGGFAKAVNEGVRRARHPLVFLLNNDIKITRGVIAGLARCFNEKDVFAVQAKMVSDPAGEDKDSLGIFSAKYGLFKYEYRPVVLTDGRPVEMDIASGGASMFSREKFLSLGLFDERFAPFYFEDLDISYRARWFGWRILYQPVAKVYHLHLGSTVKANYSARQYRFIHRKNYFLFLLKDVVNVYTFPAFLLYAVYRSLTGGFIELEAFLSALREHFSLQGGPPSGANVLYLDSPLAWPGGGQLSLLNILRNLKEYRPFVVLDGQSELVKDLRATGIPCRVIKAGKSDVLGLVPNVLKMFRSVKPRIIHCNSGTTFLSFAFAVAAKLRGIPFVWHNRVLETAGFKERIIAALASRVIVISDAVGNKFKFLPETKVTKLHNAVDLDGFRPRADLEYLYKEFALGRGTPVIGIFSRLDAWKGHELFLAAAGKVLSTNPDCVVLVVGEGEERRRLEAVVRASAISGKVLFSGYRKDIPALMNLCAVIVNPSILPEPFGRTIIEGMACAKPVIATAMGGPLEIIENGVDGLLAPADPEMIAGAIRKVVNDPAYAAEMGAKARKKVERYFDVRAQAVRVSEIYKELLGTPAGA